MTPNDTVIRTLTGRIEYLESQVAELRSEKQRLEGDLRGVRYQAGRTRDQVKSLPQIAGRIASGHSALMSAVYDAIPNRAAAAKRTLVARRADTVDAAISELAKLISEGS